MLNHPKTTTKHRKHKLYITKYIFYKQKINIFFLYITKHLSFSKKDKH